MNHPTRNGAAKVAISLPRDLAVLVDRKSKALGLTRSAYIARAVRESIAAEARARVVRAYVSAYRAHPETASEESIAHAAAAETLALIEPQDSNLDTILTVPKRRLEERIGLLPDEKVRAVDDAIRFALGLA
ncbi:MAG: hypothetical protein HY608_03405 [Planctomycetes bacterium]|nr:hypothetical protein [Planctomycetota bacterium]